MSVQVRRVYDEAGADDGARVLIDGMWPRGIRKDALDYTEWLRDVAPSKELRSWFGHQSERFSEFRERYLAELEHGERAGALRRLTEHAGKDLTLLTATKDVDHSHAAVLAELLRK
ncbi:DUF488 domain-containing protein [Haloechinothrix halophila]|uniref:DUF488 domain-containing protein n=1 Tax=Haloechinothrix halophila TaxID=1069073 RepID=UPI0004029E02|nr:DUF488 family protein [Haloechinothrix halophila]